MGVVDVVAGAVGENRVDEVGLDLRRHRALAGEAAGVAAGRLVLEVPADLAVESGDVGVDEERGRRRRAHVAGRVTWMPYSVSIPQTFVIATSDVRPLSPGT